MTAQDVTGGAPQAKTATISKTWTFEAAHRLVWHRGKCQHLHGHSYQLTVGVSGTIEPLVDPIPTLLDPMPWSHGAQVRPSSSSGMVLDFTDLSTVVKARVIDRVDHQYLNGLVSYPTAELLCHWVWDQLEGQLPDHVTVAFVEVRETATSSARITPEDRAATV